MKILALAFAVLLAPAVMAAEETPLSIWRMPHVWQRHMLLRRQLFEVLRTGDAARMEEICREAIKAIPGDATWHYNLACALAQQGKTDAALDELDKAIDFGFHYASSIEQDGDFAKVRNLPRFSKLVEKARSLAGKPGMGRPEPQTVTVRPGGKLTLGEENIAWNFDTGVYEANMKIGDPVIPLSPQAPHFGISKPTSPERPYVAAWISEGTSRGNVGDIYENRDGGHSMIAVGDFPGLVKVVASP